MTTLAIPDCDGLSSAGGTAAPMITKIEIENYKSIRKLSLELGRMNVFIGENGCGKTNILEAIALGSAASRDKLDHEYLVPRGIRMTQPELMRSAFDALNTRSIAVGFDDNAGTQSRFRVALTKSSTGIGERLLVEGVGDDGRPRFVVPEHLAAHIQGMVRNANGGDLTVPAQGPLLDWLMAVANAAGYDNEPSGDFNPDPIPFDFAIYCPEPSVLRRLDQRDALVPVGVRGEGLLDHLQTLAEMVDAPAIAEINEQLALLDWFERFEVPSRDMAGRALRIRDRYLAEGVVFDQKSANEGFLFLLFYLTLFISPHTPRFFAIDNVDASLNPKLCQALMASMVSLAKQHDKQAIVTTHNPSLLDGLNLHDDDQRLFAVSRGLDGETRIRRVSPPKPLPGDEPVRLSEAFINGFIGGLPKNF